MSATEAMTMPGRSRPWRWGAAWVILFLALPVVATGVVFGVAARLGVGFAPLQPQIAAFLVYGVLACGLTIVAVWLWARPRGLVGAIFLFRRPTTVDWLVALAAWIVGIAIFPLTQRLAFMLFGARLRGMNFDLHSPGAVVMMALAAVIVGPLAEEILFRGLGVAYLQARGWPGWAVWLAMVLAFCAIHLPAFGVAGAFFVLFWGAMVTAIRLWRDSLTPGWIAHILNNMMAYIVFPLIMTRH